MRETREDRGQTMEDGWDLRISIGDFRFRQTDGGQVVISNRIVEIATSACGGFAMTNSCGQHLAVWV